MTDSPANRAADLLPHALAYRTAIVRWPLIRSWLLHVVGLILVGQAIALAPLAFVYSPLVRSTGSFFFVAAVVFSLLLGLIGWHLLLPRFSVLFLRSFYATPSQQHARSLFNVGLTPYFKVVSLYDARTCPASIDLASTGGCLLSYAMMLLGACLYSLLISGGISLWLLLPLWLFSAVKISKRIGTRQPRPMYHLSDQQQQAAMHQDVEHWLERRRATRLQTIISVPSGPQTLWQNVILGLTHQVDVVILDLSRMGEGLAWETETLLPQLGTRAVLFGDAHTIRGWMSPKNLKATEAESRIRVLLAGKRILIARPGWFGESRFRLEFSLAVLSAAIDARTQRATQSNPRLG